MSRFLDVDQLTDRFPFLVTGLFLAYGIVFGIGVNVLFVQYFGLGEVLFWGNVFTGFFIVVFGVAIYTIISTLQSATRSSRQKLETQQQRLELALRAGETGVWEMDLKTDEKSLDPRTREIFQLDDGASGGLFDRVHPDDQERGDRELERSLETGELQLEYRIHAREGEAVRWVEVEAIVLYDDKGTPTGRIGTVRDISARRRREREADQLATRLQLALEGTNTGVWELDLETGDVLLDEQSERLFSYSPGEGHRTQEEFMERVHPEDRQRILEAQTQELEDDDQGPLEVTYRIRPPEGEQRWIESRADVIYENGQPTSLIGIQTDVTARKKREDKLRRYKRAIDHSGHAIFMTEPDGTITYVNPAFEEITGYEAEEVRGRNPRILKSGVEDDEYYRELWETIRAGDVWQNQIVNQRKDGELYHADQTIAPLTTEDGTVEAFVAIQQDITELKETQQQLQKLARRDSLTGLDNKREFNRTLNEEWNRACRADESLGMVMIDLDRFKQYNDRYGHLRGDDVLQTLGDLIRDSLNRPGDLGARFGGEEFVVILPETDEDGAFQVARRIWANFASLNIPHETSDVADVLTLSAGVAALRPGERDREEQLIKRADQALYRAKDSGRNCVKRHSRLPNSDCLQPSV